MATTISDTEMSSDECAAWARWSEHAAADGHGACAHSEHPGRLLTRNESIAAMVLAEAEAGGRGDTPHAAAWRAELRIGG